MTNSTVLMEESIELSSASTSEEMHEIAASDLEEASIILMEDLAGQEIIMGNRSLEMEDIALAEMTISSRRLEMDELVRLEVRDARKWQNIGRRTEGMMDL